MNLCSARIGSRPGVTRAGAEARCQPDLRTGTTRQVLEVTSGRPSGGGADDPANEHNLRTNIAALTLRDLEGPESDELCNVLEVCETGRRVLLRRAGSKLRNALEEFLERE